MKKHITILTLSLTAIAALHAQSPSMVAPQIPTELSPQQLTGVVIVSGKGGSGTAFLCKTKDKVLIVTNQHVLAGNGDATFKIQSGRSLPIKSIYFAESADLALLEPEAIPEGITPFELLEAPELNAKKDDAILIPGNSKGDGVVTQTPGKLIAIGPERVETDNPVYPGNSGSPIIHLASGKVIGVLTEAQLISLNEFEKASFRNKQSAIKSEIRYFGYRPDTVSKWSPMNWRYFQETQQLLQQAHDELYAIHAYFTDSSDRYKYFKELHVSRNRAAQIWHQRNRATADKVKAFERFLRDIDYLSRRVLLQLEKRQLCYIQRKDVENLTTLSNALRSGVAVAKRDSDLQAVLLQRGN